MKKSWIIVRQGTYGKPNKYNRMKHFPTIVYFDKQTAKKELKRLTKKYPNDDFMLFESKYQLTYKDKYNEFSKRKPTITKKLQKGE